MQATDSQTKETSSAYVAAKTVKEWLHDGREIALLDVREHGQYGEDHLFYGVNVPYSRLEIEAPRLVPSLNTRIVAYDEDGRQVAPRAAVALRKLGYHNVSVLEGGVSAWKAAGLKTFAGVNLPSKTFGELAEHVLGTPHISATELAARLARKDNLVVLDGRPFDEYQKMSIPTGICVPNGELPLRAQAVAPDPTTTIVINCAGRTRSIIGAQTLIDFGIPNPVFALENGTQGWYLADFELEHGQTRRYDDAVDASQLPQKQAQARAHAERVGVPYVDAQTVSQWLQEPDRNTFICDIRTREEFQAGTVNGARHTPGGQLIQATDLYVGVRKSRLVIVDSEAVRAPVVAAWLHRLGWDVHVLREGTQATLPTAVNTASSGIASTLSTLDATALKEAIADGAQVVDLRPSTSYRANHIDGSVWSIRPVIGAASLKDPLVFVAPNAQVAELAKLELGGTHKILGVSIEGPKAWKEAGLPVSANDDVPTDAQSIDYLFFVHDRHAGNKAAAQQYLDWELDLVKHIDARERAAFRLDEAKSH